ncbi:uncharacterized protein BYT42DRAFT_559595 [Radiomyces spectabilis]|uniref:uncharacterized protein n=1 Tax=Radiomyces spectabilis TaxID=64574 RepID=UPI0022209B02|nr:uncharacterized protein BYT42DRAFT_559595 [Radiomyces spectabilis]KAI8388295.1 hypothetical protein BYT42DRAFT_559595 [Radiomyces spectabilis]
MKITRDHALCALFCEEFNEQNVILLRKRLEKMNDFEICYESDPAKPVLLPLRRLYGNPTNYHKYDIVEGINDKQVVEKFYST